MPSQRICNQSYYKNLLLIDIRRWENSGFKRKLLHRMYTQSFFNKNIIIFTSQFCTNYYTMYVVVIVVALFLFWIETFIPIYRHRINAQCVHFKSETRGNGQLVKCIFTMVNCNRPIYIIFIFDSCFEPLIPHKHCFFRNLAL